MAIELKELHDKIKLLKDYLVKIGPCRRTTKVKEEKFLESTLLYDKFNSISELIAEEIATNKIKSTDIGTIELLSNNIKVLHAKIIELCSLTDDKKSTEDKMENFDLKTAISLLPVMTDEEKITKQLISNIEMYDQMLDVSGKKLLITFILKSRLSESAKLRMCENYSCVSELTADMRLHLLSKKSDTTIQQRLQRARQDRMSVEAFGKQIEEMFVDLTISQANGDSKKYEVLKPINERNAIKRFSDGLRNTRLSTIIAARNYSTLREAVQGALDEELSSCPEGQVMNFTSQRGRGRYNSNRRVNFQQRGHTTFYRGQSRGNNYNHSGNQYGSNNSWTNSRGRGGPANRGYNNRGSSSQNRNHQVNVVQGLNDDEQQTPDFQKLEVQNQFFRA